MPDVFLLDLGHGRRMPQVSLALLSLARQQMALEAFVPLDLAASRHTKPFRRRSIGFNLRHFPLL
jgi:hypothetical protein